MQAFLNTRYYIQYKNILMFEIRMLEFIAPQVPLHALICFNINGYYGSLLFTNTVTGKKRLIFAMKVL